MIIAGGGTGGHLFPGIAVAEELLKRNDKNRILFIGTERGLEKKVLNNLGFQLNTLDVEGIKGRGLVRILGALIKIPRSLLQAYRVIRSFSPHLVLGVGGYASGPAVITARFMGIRTAIMEQNALPGITNRILGKFVDRIFLTFPDREKWFPEKKTIVFGNPVRSSFLSGSLEKNKSVGTFTILIFGGSQGAHAINTAVVSALSQLRKMGKELRIIHQTGERELNQILMDYRKYDMDAEVVPFILDMAAAYRSADLLVCRAGATSIAEITASGKASILIPFPFAANDHQTKNAEVLVNAGAAVMIHEKDLSGQKLVETIENMIHNPEIIQEMEENSARLGNAGAASDIVNFCIKMTI